VTENSNNIYTIFSGLQDALAMENTVQNSTASYNPKLYQYQPATILKSNWQFEVEGNGQLMLAVFFILDLQQLQLMTL
jgi:hypothetical protein